MRDTNQARKPLENTMRVAAICMAFVLEPVSVDALAQGANNVMEKIHACSLLAPTEELECLEKLSRENPLPRPSAAPVPEVASQPARSTASSAPKAAASEAARADALARDLDAAQRKIEALTAAAKAAASEAAQIKEAAERAAVAEKALPQERARADALARDLDAAQRKIEALTAAAKAAASEAAQAKQAAERSATAEKALLAERARANALARDLDAAQRKIEDLTAAAKTANGETARVREEATRGAEELQRSRQQERARTAALERDLEAARRELEAKINAVGQSADEATRLQTKAERAAAELRHELQEERYKAEKLARELEMQALNQAESAAAYKKSLAQERSRNQELAQELAARRDTTVGAARTTTASPPDTPGPAPGMASEATTTSLAKADKGPLLAGAKPATMASPAGPEASGDPEAARLMTRANLLLSQGDVGAARMVLEHIAESGNASALFALAETYDPRVLSAWGTVGTKSDIAKARELYGRALAGGVHEAKDRLSALP